MNTQPTCPNCGQNDRVEPSVSPERWDGYCYRCFQPFNGAMVGLQRHQKPTSPRKAEP